MPKPRHFLAVAWLRHYGRSGMSPTPSNRNAFLELLETIKAPIDAELERVLTVERHAFGSLGVEVSQMLECASNLCQGGKRLRAGLIATGYELVSGCSAAAEPLFIRAGVAIELLQSYFLIHDDWMDQDATRRGNPTVHVALAQRFGNEHAGACGAILAGDFLVTLAHRIFHGVALGSCAAAALLEEFSRMQLAAIAGQQLDVIGVTRNALSVYELKTGSYTVSGPLSIGLLLAGAPSTVVPLVDRFALPVGIAFQLRDDLLNLFSGSDRTGKPQGSDITAGKWTWTAQWVREHASDRELRTFDEAFNNRGAAPDALRAALDVVETSGARRATETYIRELERVSVDAGSALETHLNLPARGQSLLGSAVQALLHRDA